MMLQTELIKAQANEPAITYRQAMPKDIYSMYSVGSLSVADLTYRMGIRETNELPGALEFGSEWRQRIDLNVHLANTAEYAWVAEQAGTIVGYARTVRRDGLRELTELFVLPDVQSGGVGRELLNRAFPVGGANYRCIIATNDVRAQALYLKANVYPRFPIYTFSREPEILTYHSNLSVEPLVSTPETMNILGKIDDVVLGHRRDVDHRWLLSNRDGFLYTMNDQVLGYGYIGKFSGPFALYDPAYFPVVVAHAETESAVQGYTEFALDVPMLNQTVAQYLLARGYRIDPFFCQFMSDAAFGQFDRYISTSPVLIL